MRTVLISLALVLLGVGIGVWLGLLWASLPKPKRTLLKELEAKDEQIAHLIWLDRKANFLIFDLCSRAFLVRQSDAQKWQAFLLQIFQKMAHLYGRKDAWDFNTEELLQVANEIQGHLTSLGLYRVSLSSVKRALAYWKRSRPIVRTSRVLNLAQSLYSLSPQGLVLSLSAELAGQGVNRLGQTLGAGLTAKKLYSDTPRYLERIQTLKAQIEKEFLRVSLRDLQDLLYDGNLTLSAEEVLGLSSALESLVLASLIEDSFKVDLLQELKAESLYFLRKGKRRHRLRAAFSRWMGKRLSQEEALELLARLRKLLPPEFWANRGPAKFWNSLLSRFEVNPAHIESR